MSVRATNGTEYATLPNSVRIGDVYALWGQGQAGAIPSGQSGNYVSWFSDLWGYISPVSPFSANESLLLGPPVTANFVPGQSVNYGGDRFGITGNGIPLSEGVAAFDQTLSNVFGNPISFLYPARDGVGFGIYALGGSTQAQTLGSGTGSALTWCSATKFCSNVDVGQPLLFNAASLTGAWFSGSVGTGTVNGATVPVLTATTRQGGALEPGMVLNTPNAPTLVRCLTGCLGVTSFPINFSGSTWLLSNNLDNGVTGNMRADPVGVLLPAGSTTTPWPNLNIQQNGSAVYGFAGFGWPLVKAGTFKITDTDPATGIATTLCQDSQAFAYNNTGGNCTPIVGASPAVASAFVNYQTGDYQVTFSTAPTSGHAITASWTNDISPETIVNAQSRPQGFDFLGDGTSQGGPVSSQFSELPGGVTGQIFSTEGTDKAYYLNTSGGTTGYQFGGIGYSQMVSWLFDSRFPNTIPGASANVQFLATGIWRVEGPQAFQPGSQGDFFDGISEQRLAGYGDLFDLLWDSLRQCAHADDECDWAYVGGRDPWLRHV